MLGDPRLFDDTLASALRYRADNSQILVVHDGSHEDTYGLEGEVDFVSPDSTSAKSSSKLIRLFNCGLEHATGELIALIRPGVELDENWESPVVDCFENDQVGCVTPLLVTPDNPNTIVACGVKKGIGFRRKIAGGNAKIAPRTLSRIRSMGPTSWAGFYRASALKQIGVCDEQLDSHYLDLDLALSLNTLGFQNQVASECVVLIERSTLVESELTLAHGKSAQRANNRHDLHAGTSSPIVGTVGTVIAEMASAPFQPWQFKHAVQRIGARRFANRDHEFADHLDAQAEKIRQQPETDINVFQANSGRVESTDNGHRRAA